MTQKRENKPPKMVKKLKLEKVINKVVKSGKKCNKICNFDPN